MTRLKETGYTVKQKNYALKSFAGDSSNKKQIALNSGYTMNAANSVKSKIENTQGYKNAMSEILAKSDNLVLKLFSEYKRRGLSDFTDTNLIAATRAISEAWSKFNDASKGDSGPESSNRLRTVILQRIENQTLNSVAESAIIDVVGEVEKAEEKVEDPNDF